MQIGMQQISAEAAEWFAAACGDAGQTRMSLARGVCEMMDWRGPTGDLCLASARRMLPRLAAALDVRLPAAQAMPCATHRPGPAVPAITLTGPLSELGAWSLTSVTDGDDCRRWDAMMATHHPEGWARAPGGQVRYWIRSSHGILGGIGFAAAGLQLGPRDRTIGWSADARMANIGRIVTNHRFLLRPGVRVRKLAASVLRVAAARIADDWTARYGQIPVLLQTFVGPDHSGLSYRAAGWRCCPELTAGRRSGVRRAVWLKPLAEGWQETLCREPRRVLGWSGTLHGGDSWAEREYGRSPHPDGRVRRRIVQMGTAWMQSLGASLPVIFPGRAEQTGAYRLLSNAGVTMAHILDSHVEQTVERCAAERLVLAIQDTTTLNFEGLDATADLDDLGGGGKGVQGLLAHVGITVNAVGRPRGLFMAHADFRQAPGKDNLRWVQGLERAQQLAQACPRTRVINVCDREGDFWQLLAQADRAGQELLVRASRGVQRQVVRPTGDTVDLWDHVQATAPVGTRTIKVPARGGPHRRRERVAKLTVRCTAVNLRPPKEFRTDPPIPMIAVSAREESPPARVRRKSDPQGGPLHWMLLISPQAMGGDAADLDSATTVLHWYELRWRIERFFHALKQGTRIEDRHLDTADDLRKCFAFDAITAFRVWDLTHLARTRTGEPARRFVCQDEITVLCVLATERGFLKARALSLAHT